MRQAERCRIYAEIQASEPEQNSKYQPQFIEKLFIVRIQQASPPVQMQRKRGASEPRIKAESGSQSIYNKRVCAQGSDPSRVWNVADCIYAQEALLKGVFPKGATEQPRHLNRNKTRKIHCNSLRYFLLRDFSKHLHRFRCSGKGKHLNLVARQNPAANPLTTNVLQEFRQLCPWFRSQTGLNTTECKCALAALLARVSTKHATEQPMHLNRNKTQKIHCNSLRYFLLRDFSKHLHRFRWSGKGKHLNLASRQNPAAKPLTTNVLQDFRQLCQRFRSQHGLECRRMQMRTGGTSGRGIHQTRSRVVQASEPENNSNKPLQLIERLSVAGFQQASPPVQMQRKRGASEPRIKAESGSQSIYNKRVSCCPVEEDT